MSPVAIFEKEEPLRFNPEAFLAKVSSGTTISEYRPDETLFSQGETAKSIFYVQQGKVVLIAASRQGKKAATAILGAGDFLGEGCLAGQAKRMATATAITACSVVRIEKAAARRLLHEEHDFLEFFVLYLLARGIRIEEDLEDRLFNSSEQRLARVLLLLNDFSKEHEPETAFPKMSQKTLAEIAGTTRSRVSFFLNRFRKLGFIDYNGHLEVHRSLLNVVRGD